MYLLSLTYKERNENLIILYWNSPFHYRNLYFLENYKLS